MKGMKKYRLDGDAFIDSLRIHRGSGAALNIPRFTLLACCSTLTFLPFFFFSLR
jgi:hypothetical protein